MLQKISFILFVFLATTSFAKNIKATFRSAETIRLMCKKETIQQFVDVALTKQELKERQTIFKNEARRKPVGISLDILRGLEQNIFGRSLFYIEDDVVPGLSGATFNGTTITVSEKSYNSVLKEIANFKAGISFVIAHELGHFIQSLNTDLKFDLSKYSKEEVEIIKHTQTDCIALNLLDRSHVKYDLATVLKNITIITSECKDVRAVGFCQKADEMRKYALRSYLNDLAK